MANNQKPLTNYPFFFPFTQCTHMYSSFFRRKNHKCQSTPAHPLSVVLVSLLSKLWAAVCQCSSGESVCTAVGLRMKEAIECHSQNSDSYVMFSTHLRKEGVWEEERGAMRIAFLHSSEDLKTTEPFMWHLNTSTVKHKVTSKRHKYVV